MQAIINTPATIKVRQYLQNSTCIFSDILVNEVQMFKGLQNAKFPIPYGIFNAQLFEHSPTETRIKLIKVPNHSDIELHIANFIAQLKGCVAVGMFFEDNILKESKKAMDELLNLVRNASVIRVCICKSEDFRLINTIGLS